MENREIENKQMENKKIEIKNTQTGINPCPVCNRPTELRIQNDFLGEHIVRIKCDCERAKFELEEKERKERKSEFAMQNVFNVINRRWESGKPLIITTNLTLDEMDNMKSMQEQRIYDRIRDMCIPVLVDGPSKRAESADDKKELFRRIFGEEE